MCSSECRRDLRLAAIAPRIASALASLRLRLAWERRRREWLRERVLDAERCVAHRELQLVRSGHRGGRYLRGRHRLLAEAQRELDTYRRMLADAEAAA